MTATERERLVRETRWRIQRANTRNRLELGTKCCSQEQMNQSLARMVEGGASDAACVMWYLLWIKLRGRA
jgi:hypothetical protein